jgi:hypothetical protein
MWYRYKYEEPRHGEEERRGYRGTNIYTVAMISNKAA